MYHAIFFSNSFPVPVSVSYFTDSPIVAVIKIDQSRQHFVSVASHPAEVRRSPKKS